MIIKIKENFGHNQGNYSYKTKENDHRIRKDYYHEIKESNDYKIKENCDHKREPMILELRMFAANEKVFKLFF